MCAGEDFANASTQVREQVFTTLLLLFSMNLVGVAGGVSDGLRFGPGRV